MADKEVKKYLSSENIPDFIKALLQKLDERYKADDDAPTFVEMDEVTMSDCIASGIQTFIEESGKVSDTVTIKTSVNSLALDEFTSKTLVISLSEDPIIETIIKVAIYGPDGVEDEETLIPSVREIVLNNETWETGFELEISANELKTSGDATYRLVLSSDGLKNKEILIKVKYVEKETPLVINSYHGGGGGDGAISHNYVELYNNSDEDIDLAGYAIQHYSSAVDVTAGRPEIIKLNLEGVIKAHHSFFIAGTENTESKKTLDLTHQVENADMTWNYNGLPIKFDNKGIGFALTKTTDLLTGWDVCPITNPACIDCISSMSDDGVNAPWVLGSPAYAQSKQKIVRKIVPCKSYDNSKDCVIISYKDKTVLPAGNPLESLNGNLEALIALGPKCGADGAWFAQGNVDITKFIHITDSQANTEAGFDNYANALAVAVKDAQPEFVVHSGDLIENTGDNEANWNWFKTKTEAALSGLPFYPAKGNNDVNYDGQYVMENACPNNTNAYYKEVKDALLLFLDTEDSNYLNNQVEWATNLLKNTNKKWKIVIMHRAPYTSIKEDSSDGVGDMYATWRPIFDETKVDLVLTGHKHMYMRSFKYKNDVQDESGTMYIMGNSMGVKQGSLDDAQPWMEVRMAPGMSCYNEVTVSNENISVVCKKINVEENTITKIDSVVITKYVGDGEGGSTIAENAIVDADGNALIDANGNYIIFG